MLKHLFCSLLLVSFDGGWFAVGVEESHVYSPK
jgi:hypothetical protein